MSTLGRIAYESSNIGPLAWDELHGRTREHWERIAMSVAREVRNRLLIETAERCRLAESGETSPAQLWSSKQ